MAIRLAQTFYIDKSSVRDAEHVTITSLDLYFKAKPLATGNKSGINNPGVSVYLTETVGNDIPDLTSVLQTGNSRLEYASILPSADASIVANFVFSKACVVETNKSYSIIVDYDGDEDFSLWTCKEGDIIVGTNTVTSGATAKNVGKYFEYTSSTDSPWNALSNVDLKFALKIGVYSADATSTQLAVTYLLPSDHLETIMYDRYHYRTTHRTDLQIGEMMFLETPVVYGPISVDSSNLTITSTGSVNFSNLIKSSTYDPNDTVASTDPVLGSKSYIVLRNGTSSGAAVNVREVTRVLSNTQIQIDRAPSFTNGSAVFSVTAAGKVQYDDYHWYDGRWWNGGSWDSYIGRKMDMVRLTDSNANSTVRFVNNYVQQITINSGGQNYSNSDVITIYPIQDSTTADATSINYIQSFSNATANVVTNGTGTITGISITNAGFGLVAQTAVAITTSAGVSANLTVEVGSMLRCETSGATFGNTVAYNTPVHITYPHLVIDTNQNTQYKMYQHYPYYTYPGKEHILYAANPAAVKEVDSFTNYSAADLISNDGRVYVLASRSNEVVMANAVLQTANGNVVNTQVQSSSILEVAVTSNNAYCLPLVNTDDVYSYNYIINNDITGETKGNGKALAKHISSKITFADTRAAEDILVYINAYRPAGTDIHVYARLYNNADSDSFDDKDWTLLTLQSNNASSYSSLTNTSDIISYSFGLAGSAVKTVNTISGSITTSLNSANVAGVGTAFTHDLKTNDVVKLYSSLFPQNYIITVVKNVTSDGILTLGDTVANNSYVGSGFKLDLIGRPAVAVGDEIGYPFQAFSDKYNDNVVAYYNSNMAKFSSYNTFQIKMVLTSNNNAVVPKIENISGVGVSA